MNTKKTLSLKVNTIKLGQNKMNHNQHYITVFTTLLETSAYDVTIHPIILAFLVGFYFPTSAISDQCGMDTYKVHMHILGSIQFICYGSFV